MNGAILLLGGCGLFTLAYLFYSKFIAKAIGVDPERPTPAHTMRDGIDFVPAHPMVLFGHHFAAIAGAGPIIGPVLAAQFGWASVALWIILGCIFIGSMHDMITLFLSVRHSGRSIGTIIEDVLGRSGKMIFLMFCFTALVLVMSVFTGQVAQAFTASPEVATSSILGMVEAAVFGLCVYKLRWNVWWASLVFVPLLFFLVWVGVVLPFDLTKTFGMSAETATNVWIGVILIYCFVASTLPVWLLLQPRDYLNSYLLYAMLALGLVGILVVMPAVDIDAFVGFSQTIQKKMADGTTAPVTNMLFPLLFVTVACGACSGFHALVASGTTSKQLDNERHVRPIGYGCMLLEGVVALMSLVSVACVGLGQAGLLEKLGEVDRPVVLFAHGLASICAKMGLPAKSAEGFILLAVAAFLLTSVDACTRLARFVWQELWSTAAGGAKEEASAQGAEAPKRRPLLVRLNGNMYFATLVVVLIGVYLLIFDPVLSKNLWTMFASANQMLAALTLLTATLWLLKNRLSWWIALLPMMFMLVTSGTAVFQLFMLSASRWLKAGFGAGGVTAIGSATLLVLAAVLVVLGVVKLRKLVKNRVLQSIAAKK